MRAKAGILLAEDNPSDVELTLRALKAEWPETSVTVVRDGEEALDYLFHQGAFSAGDAPLPRLILLDLKLPRLDGLQVLRALKADPRTRPIPVVVLTSSTERSDLISCYQSSANSYVQKPLDYQRFRELVRQIGQYWLTINEPPPEDAFAAGPAPS